MKTPTLRVKRVVQEPYSRDDIVLPKRGSAKAAGYDLCSLHDGVVPKRGKAMFKTGLAIAVPENTYGRIAPRSSLTWKKALDVGAGVIDADYTGEVGIILFNHSDVDVEIKQKEAIAQLILERIETPEVEEVEELDQTERGISGFGSTSNAESKNNNINTVLKETQ